MRQTSAWQMPCCCKRICALSANKPTRLQAFLQSTANSCGRQMTVQLKALITACCGCHASTGPHADGISSHDSSVKCTVKAAGTPTATCACPAAQLHCMCMHLMSVLSGSAGYSGAQAFRHYTHVQGPACRASTDCTSLGLLQLSASNGDQIA